MIVEAIGKVVEGGDLEMDEAASVMNEIMSGDATHAQFGAFVTALRIKGETPDEIAGMARVMREKSLHVRVDGPTVDTCGTGGDASRTFNISTTVGFVLAGLGEKVAKHGNRAMSGACGSADVLEALGVNIELGPEGVARCIEEVGYGFMFAQKFHPSMKFAAGPRREIGIRTVFNILGPLTNPAGASAQLIGVADPAVGEKMATVLGMLGSKHALVVHGSEGLDEISLDGPTRVWELKGGDVRTGAIEPDEFALAPAAKADLTIANADDGARRVREVLDGRSGPARDIVLANAAGALVAADRVSTYREGVELAAESLDSGRAMRSLERLVELSQKLE